MSDRDVLIDTTTKAEVYGYDFITFPNAVQLFFRSAVKKKAFDDDESTKTGFPPPPHRAIP